jgi:GWxTD domain-containing protein
VKRGATGLVVGVLALLALAGAPAAPGSAESPEARRAAEIRRAWKRDPGNDSLKYELAMASAAVGTIEDRRQALQLFHDIRSTYWREPRYHRDRARVYELCQQHWQACASLEELLKIDPNDVPARVELARLTLIGLLYHYDLPLTRRMIEVLEPALALEPDNPAVLFYHSLALEMASGLPSVTSPALSARGLAEADRLAALEGTDYRAHFLAAVHAMDLGRHDQAARRFETALRQAPEDVRSAFQTAEWTAPVAAVKGLKSRDAAGRAAYERAYWRHHDPSPLTALNENQLEIWKRLALADFLFGRPDRGVRGWNTEPGLAFVRYGAPQSHHFDPGEIVSVGGGGAGRAGIYLEPPSWSWRHRFKGLQFNLHFIDSNLNGDFRADIATTKTLGVLREAQPVVFHVAPPGPLRYLAVTSAGVLAEKQRVRENVYLGVPLWRPVGDGRWLENVTMELTVRDSTRTIIRRAQHVATPEDIVPMLGEDVSVMLLNQPWLLLPGSYTVTGYVEDTDRKLHGVYTGPLVIPDYSRVTGPVISDLDLTLRPERRDSRVAVTRLGSRYIPNPLRVASDDRQLDLFYEVYGLADKSGIAFIETNYRVLPRAWVEGFDRMVRAGETSPDRMLDSADADYSSPDGELTTKNYLDVTFPPAGLDVVNGRGQKGARVPVTHLAPGEYDLVMTIRDLRAGTSATASTWFQVLSPEQREELVAMGRGTAGHGK